MIDISESKSSLKRILLEHDGDTAHPSVQNAIENLTKLATLQRGDKERNVTQHPKNHTGRWRTISTPPFPGRILSEDGSETKAKYTLGRMSFNMFKPAKAVCAVDEIVNVIEKLEESSGDDGDKDETDWEQCYNLEVRMEISVPQKQVGGNAAGSLTQLPARLINYGRCKPTSPTRLAVKFNRGTLQPNFDMTLKKNEVLTNAWKEIFDGVIRKEHETQSILDKLKTIVGKMLMKLIMGLDPPVDCVDLTQTYTIARPIAGHLDILYMDDDLRISMGNRGTVVVVERI